MTHDELATRVLSLVGPLWRTRGQLMYRGRWRAARDVSKGELLHAARQMSPMRATERSQWWRTHRAGQRNPQPPVENPNIVGDELVYRVIKRGGDYYVEGLPNDWGDPHTMLLYFYPEGDVDSPTNHDMMLGALYGLWQVSDQLQDALRQSGAKRIVFITPFGRFKTHSFHVVPYDTQLPNPAGLTAKGERMYEHIKAGYGRSGRAEEIAARTVIARAQERPELGLARRGYYGNPADAEPGDLNRGVKMFLAFHRMPVTEIGTFDGRVAIPADGYLLGSGSWITYRSGKWGDGSHEYIHEFGKGVRIADFERGDRVVPVPQKFHNVQTLVKLGTCLGFAFKEGGEEVEAKTGRKKPELYCTPSGRALFVIENKRHVLAGMWGGKLGVEERGIVG